MGAAAILLTLALVLLAPGCGSETDTDTDAAPVDPAERRIQAEEQTEQLAQRFQAAAEHGGQLAPLIEEGHSLVQTFHDHPPAHLLLGQMYLAGQRGREALKHARNSLEIEPDQPEVQLIAGSIAFNLQEYALAQEHYELAVRFNPTAGRPRLHLARAYIHQNQYELALQELLEALRLDSSLYQAHAALADLYARQNKLTLAVDQIQRALEMVPDDQEEHHTLYLREYARFLRRLNQPADALDVLRQLPPRQTFEPEVIEELAACWAMLGQPELAAAQYEQARILDPTDPDFAAGAAQWHLRARNVNGAQRAIDELHRLNSQDPRLADLRTQLQRVSRGD